MNDLLFSNYESILGQNISGKIVFFIDVEKHEDFIQGVLKSCDKESQTITIEQHIPFMNLLKGEQTITFERVIAVSDFINLDNFKI